MSEMAKETFKQVSESMFPGITHSLHSKPPEIRLGHEIVTNLSLQMCLFFNVCYFPFWLIISILITSLKYEHLNYLYKFILVTVLAATIAIEIVRLYLGYLGNLMERVPELAGFWLLSVLLQFPLQAFLFFNEDLVILPLERAANFVMVGLVLAELITGFIALRKITKHQAKKFHLLQLRQEAIFEFE
ncbi:hypothetical protein TCAL_04134 [Tigriopus californicus]|uniref:Transmembrane protein 17B n=1 Tax=Tigriopus californicus TaxID=6832 RepID=A0A553NUE7_TIGCA|nr:transmembrane protein 17-like [Tigriopus californicus]TRY69058.1 hypothetical protein TCAL_04134 [Tigriopus californicus]|eukprot:TCALIF_04134-PA protein Name:"Similar to Tmem17b Transmembrane protein 17B (Danio rerio)" AED:0.04 eAED:0.04 QI:90/1/1/1/1/1/2/23/187